MKQRFLEQFLNKILKFPNWVKEIIYNRLAQDLETSDNYLYAFVSYHPVLSYKGKSELDEKKSGYDRNIYNMLKSVYDGFALSDIILNSYMSMEEVAKYFLLCLGEGYFEKPEDKIINIANQLSGKTYSNENISKEAQRRFILDFDEIPVISDAEQNIYRTQINELKSENRILQNKLKQLLTMVVNNNE